jgi:hypothetical protein
VDNRSRFICFSQDRWKIEIGLAVINQNCGELNAGIMVSGSELRFRILGQSCNFWKSSTRASIFFYQCICSRNAEIKVSGSELRLTRVLLFWNVIQGQVNSKSFMCATEVSSNHHTYVMILGAYSLTVL